MHDMLSAICTICCLLSARCALGTICSLLFARCALCTICSVHDHAMPDVLSARAALCTLLSALCSLTCPLSCPLSCPRWIALISPGPPSQAAGCGVIPETCGSLPSVRWQARRLGGEGRRCSWYGGEFGGHRVETYRAWCKHQTLLAPACLLAFVHGACFRSLRKLRQTGPCMPQVQIMQSGSAAHAAHAAMCRHACR